MTRSVNMKTMGSWVAKSILLCGFSAASLGFFAAPGDSWAAGARMMLQDYDATTVPKNLEGIGYPTAYQSSSEGGPLTISLDIAKKIGGAGSLKLRLLSGSQFYPQWNPWDGVSRDFARRYSENPAGWQFNTYNRFRFWFFVPTTGGAEQYDGQTNFYVGTYVKRVTNADRSSDEAGGGHYYHSFNVLRNQWSMCTFNSHPGHERGDNGGVDSGNRLYPTAPPWGSGDPANTYNYFDTLTRFYIQESRASNTFPRDYWLDELEFYQETWPENDDQVYSICVSYTAASNRFFLTWNRLKDENSVKHEVRYAFSDIHALGWNNATPAPSGTITPPGWQGYNSMVYNTTGINVSGKSQIYLAIKPQNSSTFSQVAFPLTGNPASALSEPTNLRVVN